MLFGKRYLIRVSGDSMYPLLKDNDLVFVNPNAYKVHLPSVDDIVVARHPYQKSTLLIKKVDSIDENDKLFLLGINKASSTDSRSFGSVSKNHIKGKVVGMSKHKLRRV